MKSTAKCNKALAKTIHIHQTPIICKLFMVSQECTCNKKYCLKTMSWLVTSQVVYSLSDTKKLKILHQPIIMNLIYPIYERKKIYMVVQLRPIFLSLVDHNESHFHTSFVMTNIKKKMILVYIICP